jgi:hypothetical protein
MRVEGGLQGAAEEAEGIIGGGTGGNGVEGGRGEGAEPGIVRDDIFVVVVCGFD